MLDLHPIGKELSQAHHLLIAGQTGSGKSQLLHNVIASFVEEGCHFAVIDLKKMSLNFWKKIYYCEYYMTTPEDALTLLNGFIYTTNERLDYMEKHDIDMYDGVDVYLVIDEAAELFDTVKGSKDMVKTLTRLGRAAKVHVIMATQSPNRKTIGADVTLNFDVKVGLHCDNIIESKQIVGISGCELLPQYGSCIVKAPGKPIRTIEYPMVSNEVYEIIKDRYKKTEPVPVPPLQSLKERLQAKYGTQKRA